MSSAEERTKPVGRSTRIFCTRSRVVVNAAHRPSISPASAPSSVVVDGLRSDERIAVAVPPLLRPPPLPPPDCRRALPRRAAASCRGVTTAPAAAAAALVTPFRPDFRRRDDTVTIVGFLRACWPPPPCRRLDPCFRIPPPLAQTQSKKLSGGNKSEYPASTQS
eukprot:COSAG02_NODE_2291_length_9203_cov_4.256920_11_plen_164_part_00